MIDRRISDGTKKRMTSWHQRIKTDPPPADWRAGLCTNDLGNGDQLLTERAHGLGSASIADTDEDTDEEEEEEVEEEEETASPLLLSSSTFIR